MAASLSHRTGPLVAAALACFAAAVTVQYLRERWLPPPRVDESMLYVESGSAMSRLALAYDDLLADLYWIRAVQYFGGQTLAERARLEQDLLYPMLDIATTLDPYFNIVYRFGAVFLAEGYPDPPGRPDLAIKLLEKGFAANPTRWQYLYDAAFVHYWWLRDFRAASEWFTRASRVPGSPEWMPGLAASTLARGGNREGARFVWQQVYDTAEAPYMRDTARHNLVQLDIMDELDALNRALDRLRAAGGPPVTTWEPLAARGWLRRNPPLDPGGVPYEIDPATGRARLSSNSPYHPLPQDLPSEGSQPVSPAGAPK
jgi:tetratricopeptide (TPR) repeat protein